MLPLDETRLEDCSGRRRRGGDDRHGQPRPRPRLAGTGRRLPGQRVAGGLIFSRHFFAGPVVFPFGVFARRVKFPLGLLSRVVIAWAFHFEKLVARLLDLARRALARAVDLPRLAFLAAFFHFARLIKGAFFVPAAGQFGIPFHTFRFPFRAFVTIHSIILSLDAWFVP